MWGRGIALILLAVTAGCSPSVAPEETLTAEVDRLLAILEPVQTHGYNWQQMQSELKSRLEGIRGDLEAGRTLYALHDLSRVRNSMLAFVYTEEQGNEQERACPHGNQSTGHSNAITTTGNEPSPPWQQDPGASTGLAQASASNQHPPS